MSSCKTKRARLRARVEGEAPEHQFTADSVLQLGQGLAGTALRWEWSPDSSAQCSLDCLQEHSPSSYRDCLSALLPHSKAALRFPLWVTG